MSGRACVRARVCKRDSERERERSQEDAFRELTRRGGGRGVFKQVQHTCPGFTPPLPAMCACVRVYVSVFECACSRVCVFARARVSVVCARAWTRFHHTARLQISALIWPLIAPFPLRETKNIFGFVLFHL